jgi:hypothetical protein
MTQKEISSYTFRPKAGYKSIKKSAVDAVEFIFTKKSPVLLLILCESTAQPEARREPLPLCVDFFSSKQ